MKISPALSSAVLAGILGLAVVAAADLRLPPLAGELEGDVTPVILPGAPKLHWTLTFASPASGGRTAQLLVTGPDTAARVEARLDETGDGTWRLLVGRAALKPWLNGQLTAGEIAVTGEGTWKDGTLDGTLALELREIDLGELMKFADADRKYVRTAEGRVMGRVRVRLEAGAAAGFDGALSLAADTIGVITLQPSPGLLSSYVPEQVRKLYPGIEAIEQGRTPLEARVLRLTFHPAGDAAGRSAVLRIEGRPRDPQFIAPLELDVNISGPVESLLRKTLDSRLRIGN